MICSHFQILEKQVLILVFFLLFLIALGLLSCQNANEAPTLRVVLPQTTLRDAPGERGREIRNLAAKDRLTDLGKVSNFESQLHLGEQSLIAPWLQVETADGQIGWVFSGAVQPEQPDEHWLLDKRMRCYFGPELTLRRNRWWTTRSSLGNETDFAVFYHEALALRDTFTYQLAHRAEPNAAEVQPDFFWLREALPGFVFQRLARSTQPYLFTDYRFFQTLAKQSVGHQDDQLIDTYVLAYPTDSIESIAPAWTMQVADNAV
ncbi:MAG: SH3 domain-containing protein, partial [Saprospiraceae bacterium]